MVAAMTGTISIAAGNGSYGFSSDGGPATSAGLDNPCCVAFDGAATSKIVDMSRQIIR